MSASNSPPSQRSEAMPRSAGGVRSVLAVAMALGLAACQSAPSSFQGANFSDDTRSLEKQLNAEAVALGTAQGAAALDPTGIAAIATTQAGLAARNAQARSADERMKAQITRDEQALYRKYGMNPDGTPSGRKPATG